jgi:predicted LPLAT superfamily acyltransferase
MESSAASAAWTRRPERGSLFLVRFMVWFSLAAGRSVSRLLMRAIAVYFFLASPTARRHSHAFLRRALCREPTLGERFRLMLAFSTCIHDRVYFLAGRLDLFSVEVRGAELLPEGGALLMGAHLGSFEALRAVGSGPGHRRVAMAMYEENARRLNNVFAKINPQALEDVVPLGHVDSMIVLRDRMERGDLVGVLADRTLGEEPVVRLPFLGEPAAFPTGPMRMAAALRKRVFLMLGLYGGGNRYQVIFEELADFSGASGGRGERAAMVEAAIERYATRLEHYARAAPDNWFNFHDFWGGR